MINKLDAALSFHQTALRVRNQRQELLASNIANADTPQYKARDLDFKSAMQAALQPGTTNQSSGTGTAKQPAGLLQQTNGAHMNGSAGNGLTGSSDVLFRSVLQGSVDGNTVDMDVERNAYVDNGIRYEASLTMMSGQIKKMLSAITGQ
ncbi:MAG TPA: flagellar basal body rod protein FlgB [Methylophilus sp.]|nr:flagellar basal body rod protein FlgB [Methylophilus sp.]